MNDLKVIHTTLDVVKDLAVEIDREMDAYDFIDHSEAYRATDIVNDRKYKVIVAELDGRQVGALYWMDWRGSGFICLSYVRPEHRRQGIYRAMLEELKAECLRQKFSKISCGVDSGNQRSIDAHEHLGFTGPVRYYELAIA